MLSASWGRVTPQRLGFLSPQPRLFLLLSLPRSTFASPTVCSQSLCKCCIYPVFSYSSDTVCYFIEVGPSFQLFSYHLYIHLQDSD